MSAPPHCRSSEANQPFASILSQQQIGLYHLLLEINITRALLADLPINAAIGILGFDTHMGIYAEPRKMTKIQAKRILATSYYLAKRADSLTMDSVLLH